MNLAYLSGAGQKFVRIAMLTWFVKFLKDPVEKGGFGFDITEAAVITSHAFAGGIFFSILVGLVSDRVFKGKRWQTMVIGFLIYQVKHVRNEGRLAAPDDLAKAAVGLVTAHEMDSHFGPRPQTEVSPSQIGHVGPNGTVWGPVDKNGFSRNQKIQLVRLCTQNHDALQVEG